MASYVYLSNCILLQFIISSIIQYVQLNDKGGNTMQDCIFCKIVQGEIPCKKVYEDDQCLAFLDINPQAPVHVLVIPKVHIASLNDVEDIENVQNDKLSYLLSVVKKLAKEYNIAQSGYRTVINTGDDGGQTVHHLHIHLLGGRFMQWPPG
jgi:histidine triad (HIT) family protein